MNDSYSKWSDVRAKGRAADPRTAAEQAVGRTLAKDRHEDYIRGHLLTEMRQAAEGSDSGSRLQNEIRSRVP